MRVKRMMIWLLLFISCSAVFAQESDPDILFKEPSFNFPYKLSRPDKSWQLPKKLVEISGLSFTDDHRLACVQDEKGLIFIFNPASGLVDHEINFGEDGDYEGIEVIKNDAWVLKSNGNLYNVTDYLQGAPPSVKKYSTALSGRNNAEGLAYDPVNNALLIACKGHPYTDETEGKSFKAVYSFNLESKQLGLKPFLLINLDSIKYYRKYDPMSRLGDDVMAYLDPSEGDKSFQPSGIAIHPVNGHIYILGSVGKLLLVLSRSGKILAMIHLRPGIFPQPEGICFNPDGTLYISSEGAGGDGTILEFLPKN